MNYKYSACALSILTALSLTACDSSDSSSTDPNSTDSNTTTITAIDGYLSYAAVYIDRNKDGVADDDELVGSTNDDAQLTISNSDAAYPIIVKAISGITEDDGEALTDTYELTAEAGSEVITPFTTLAKLNDITLEELAEDLGYDEEVISGDYIAAKTSSDTDTSEDAKKAALLAATITSVLDETVSENNTTELSASTKAIQGVIEELAEDTTIDLDQVNIAITKEEAETTSNDGESATATATATIGSETGPSDTIEVVIDVEISDGTETTESTQTVTTTNADNSTNIEQIVVNEEVTTDTNGVETTTGTSTTSEGTSLDELTEIDSDTYTQVSSGSTADYEWNFSSTDGNTIAGDKNLSFINSASNTLVSTTSADGTANGAVSITQSDISGEYGYYSIQNVNNTTDKFIGGDNGSFSVEIVFKANDASFNSDNDEKLYLIDYAHSETNTGWKLYIDEDSLKPELKFNSGFYDDGSDIDTNLDANTQLTDNTWMHLVATYDGTTAKLYVNGELEAEGVMSYLPNEDSDDSFAIAGRGSDSQKNLAGSVDNVAFWSSTLDADFIAERAEEFGISPDETVNNNASDADYEWDFSDIDGNKIAGAKELSFTYNAQQPELTEGATGETDSAVSISQSDISGEFGYYKVENVSTTTDTFVGDEDGRFTIEVVFKADDASFNSDPEDGHDMYLIDYSDSETQTGWKLYIEEETLLPVIRFYQGFDNEGEKLITELKGSTVLGDNTWMHLVATYDGENGNLYVNGELEKSEAIDYIANTDNGDSFKIGSSTETQRNLKGALDNVAFWSSSIGDDYVAERAEWFGFSAGNETTSNESTGSSSITSFSYNSLANKTLYLPLEEEKEVANFYFNEDKTYTVISSSIEGNGTYSIGDDGALILNWIVNPHEGEDDIDYLRILDSTDDFLYIAWSIVADAADDVVEDGDTDYFFFTETAAQTYIDNQ